MRLITAAIERRHGRPPQRVAVTPSKRVSFVFFEGSTVARLFKVIDLHINKRALSRPLDVIDKHGDKHKFMQRRQHLRARLHSSVYEPL